jgi:hypothetical protein
MKIALFYKLNFTKVHIDLREVRYSLAEVYVKRIWIYSGGEG